MTEGGPVRAIGTWEGKKSFKTLDNSEEQLLTGEGK